MTVLGPHGGPDPLQGFDGQIYVEDRTRSTGTTSNYVWLGDFTSIVLTVRNATEPYLEMNQRIARMLDGEMQFAWVLEKGMLDISVLKQVFGFEALGRDIRFGRSPRFKITYSINDGSVLNQDISYGGNAVINAARKTQGRVVLDWCKPDTFVIASTAGRQVVANQWQGVAEGFRIYTDPGSIAHSDATGSVEGAKYFIESDTNRL